MRRMSQSSNLTELSSRYLRAVFLSTAEVLVALLVLCTPILLPLATENRTMAMFGFLGVLGWAVYFGQELALEKLSEGTERREEVNQKEVGTLYLISTLLYHNTIIFIGIALALGVAQSGSVLVAVMVAFLYPVFDTFTANRRMPIPISFGGFAAFVIWILSHAVEILRGVSWETLGLDRFSVRVVDTLENRRMPRTP